MVEGPQSAVAFIFIGRGGHTPSKSSYKMTLKYRSNSTRITQTRAGLTGWPNQFDQSASVFANFDRQHISNNMSLLSECAPFIMFVEIDLPHLVVHSKHLLNAI